MTSLTLRFLVLGLTCTLSIGLVPHSSLGQDPCGVTYEEMNKAKGFYDDPRPLFESLSCEKILPPEILKQLTCDQAAMKSVWADAVGFKAQDRVGAIAPDIGPGVYSCADKDRYGFKDLMIPGYYERFAPGGPPFSGNFPDIRVVATRQYYRALPIAEATRQYAGTVTQNDQGYMDYSTYQSGFPFPRPSGPHSTYQRALVVPDPAAGRDAVSIRNMIKGR